MNKEIERKWLFRDSSVPEDLDAFNSMIVEQTYISVEPEVRLRKCMTKDKNFVECTITFKSNGTLVRGEEEIVVSEDTYNNLIEMYNLEHKIIRKAFSEYHIGLHILQLGDVYNDDGTVDFSYGEVEFNNEQEAQAFTVPGWFGKEVTSDNSYKMKNYWKRRYAETGSTIPQPKNNNRPAPNVWDVSTKTFGN